MRNSDKANSTVNALVGSRKFWVLVLSVFPPTMLVILQELSPREFVAAVAGLCSVFIGATAYEDGQEKRGPRP